MPLLMTRRCDPRNPVAKNYFDFLAQYSTWLGMLSALATTELVSAMKNGGTDLTDEIKLFELHDTNFDVFHSTCNTKKKLRPFTGSSIHLTANGTLFGKKDGSVDPCLGEKIIFFRFLGSL